MHSVKKASYAVLFALGLGLTALGVTACAESVGDIDRTQPNLLEKSMFDGLWYVRETVIDVPPTSEITFVGETGSIEIIRWEIQEDYLAGYRGYEAVPGGDPNADHNGAGVGEQPVAPGHGEGRNPDEYKDAPIVMYPILAHVDVQREYNPRTGEQTNVIGENTTDRPWDERKYIRVNWADPKVVNFGFASSILNMYATNTAYVQQNEGGPDAFTTGQDARGATNYFDFTVKLHVEADLWGCILKMWYGEVGMSDPCGAAEVKLRSSFLKVDVDRERDYQMEPYDDHRHGEFGYFRVERPTYDRRRGVTWSGMIYLATRHDMWDKTFRRDGAGNFITCSTSDQCGQDGSVCAPFSGAGGACTIPYAQRKMRPITYTLSENYPAEMLPISRETAAEWDRTFKQTAAFLRGQTNEQLEADLLAQTGNSCLYCLDENADNHARIGDLRYNSFYWVDSNQLSSPLGYGPSSPNPETGRIVSGVAYVYGAAVDVYAQTAKDMVDLLNGDIDQEALTGGITSRDFIMPRRPRMHPEAMERFRGLPLERAADAALGPERVERLQLLEQTGLPPARRGWDQQRLAMINDTAFASLLTNDEIVMALGRGQYRPGDALPPDFQASLAPSNWATTDAIRRETQRRNRAAEHNCIWLADFDDPSIIGLARAAKNSGLTGDTLWQFLREQIFKGLMLHELGHTVGLRHNFGSSSDALNYFDDYWPLREQTLRPVQYLEDLFTSNCEWRDASNDAGCQTQEDGRMRELQYTSVMDYGAKFNSDLHGLGKYDVAAIASGYGDIVEIFDPGLTDSMDPQIRETLSDYAGFTSPIYGQLQDRIHYSELPSIFGGSANLSNRRWINRTEFELQRDAQQLVRVPYVACYDEYVGANWGCQRWDEGADAYEITADYSERYSNYYAFTNFARDRVGFSSYDVLSRVTRRYFMPMLNMYQNFIFDYGYTRDTLPGYYSQFGAMLGFSTLWNVLGTPRYGTYTQEGDMFVWQGEDWNEPGDLQLRPGQGKRPYSRYDWESGYGAYNRVAEAGFFWEQLGAIIALTSNDATALGAGADTSADFLGYSLPYYLVFQEDIDRIFTGVILDQPAKFAPTVVNGEVVARDLLMEGEDLQQPPDGYISSESVWMTRIYTMLFGMALLQSNFDQSFVRKGQIAIEGEGEPIDVGAGFQEIRVTVPTSGRTYLAYYNPADTSGSFIGGEALVQLQDLVNQYNAADEETRPELAWRIDDKVGDVEILRGLYSTFQYAF